MKWNESLGYTNTCIYHLYVLLASYYYASNMQKYNILYMMSYLMMQLLKVGILWLTEV